MIKYRYLENLKGYGHFSKDFMKVSAFLAQLHQDLNQNISFPWGRWEWMFSLPYLDADHLGSIGVFEDDGRIVGLITYESKFGEAYYVLSDHHLYLRKEIIQNAIRDLQDYDGFRILIADDDHEMQKIALKNGLIASEDKEQLAAYDLNQNIEYELPEGYKIGNMKDQFDLKKYHQILWRGFNHPGEPTMTEKDLEDRKISLSAPHINLSNHIAVIAPHGEFVSYCGTWHHEGHFVAMIEPLATDPTYRKMGLGKAAVYESMKKCQKAGAKIAIVGSGQSFYYKIGFYPLATFTWWNLEGKS